MADREITIKGLEPILECAKMQKWGAWVDTLEDAIELLKEQQQQIWELQDLTEHLKDKLKEKKKPIEDFGMFAYKKHFKGELSAENLAFINLWISKYMEQT